MCSVLPFPLSKAIIKQILLRNEPNCFAHIKHGSIAFSNILRQVVFSRSHGKMDHYDQAYKTLQNHITYTEG